MRAAAIVPILFILGFIRASCGTAGDRRKVQRRHLLAHACTIGMVFSLMLDFELPELGLLHNVGAISYDLPVEVALR
jgi:hypothetical protein